MNPQEDISPEMTPVCERHGSELVFGPAPDGTETKIAYCRFCRRYFGRVLPPQIQSRGFRPAHPEARKGKGFA